MNQQAIMQQIGQRLRAVRTRQDLTLDDIERLTDGRFPAVTVGSWERADRTISAPKLVELADLYEVPVGHLVADPPAPTPPDGPDIELRQPPSHEPANGQARLTTGPARYRQDSPEIRFTVTIDEVSTGRPARG